MQPDWNALTQRQQSFLLWLCECLHRNCRMPTLRDIGAGLNIASPNGVMCHINALIQKGWLFQDAERSARGWHIVVAPPGWVLLPGGGIVPMSEVGDLIAELVAVQLEPEQLAEEEAPSCV